MENFIAVSHVRLLAYICTHHYQKNQKIETYLSAKSKDRSRDHRGKDLGKHGIPAAGKCSLKTKGDTQTTTLIQNEKTDAGNLYIQVVFCSSSIP